MSIFFRLPRLFELSKQKHKRTLTRITIIMEDDTEFRDLIIKKLENNGVLLKLKAALRANIHNLIVENKTEDSQSTSITNDFSHDEATSVALSLIQDLFDCLNLNVTKSVFQSESGDKVKYSCKTRTDLLETLQISDEHNNDELTDCKVPALVKYLRKCGLCQKDNANDTFIATSTSSE